MASSNYKINIQGDASSLNNAAKTAETALNGVDAAAKKPTDGGKNDPLAPIGKKIDMGNIMEATETIAGVGDKVLEIGKKSIESAANVNAMNSTFKQTFGDQLPFAESQVSKLSKAYDILPNRIKPSYQQFTAMFKGLGLTTQDAAGKATQAMTISANAAAFYDKSLEDANSALQSFVKGNYEGGESIGLFANDTQMAAFAAKNDLIPATEGAKKASEELLVASEKASKKQQEAIQKHGENSLEARDAAVKLQKIQAKIDEELGPQTQKWADLDEATKQAVRLDYAENMMVQAGAIDKVGELTGQASRESGEYENQMGNMQQAIQDLYAELGKDILPIFLDVLKGGLEVIKGVANAFNSLPQPVKTFIFVLGGMLALFAQLAPVITAVVTIMSTLGTAVLLPMIGIIAAVAAAVTAAILIYQNWGAIQQWLAGILANFGSSTTAIWQGIQNVITTVSNAISTLVQQVWGTLANWWKDNQALIKRTGETVWKAIQNIIQVVMGIIVPFLQTSWNNVKTIVTTVWAVIKTVVDTAIKAVLGIIKAVMQIITGDWKGAWETIKGVVKTIWEGIKTVISTIFRAIWEKIKEIARNIGDTLSNVWGSIKQTASNMWNAIKNAITSPFKSAWNTVSGIIDNLKNAFNFTWRLPEIQLPQIPTISLDTSSVEILGKRITYPSGFNINWHAEGGIFRRPTLLGNGTHGVGEAGAEAVIPLNSKTLGGIGSMIAQTMDINARSGGAKTIVNNINIDWQGDIDSPDRTRELADVILNEITEQNRNGFN